jgi:hypothetical protein
VSLDLTLDHEGATYAGHIARIASTHLGPEDHGIWTFFLHVEWPGAGVGIGGFGLDTYDGERRIGTAYGMDMLMRVLETVGVARWEDIPGRNVIVLFEKNGGYAGQRAVGLASIDGERVLILSEVADRWRNEDGSVR